MVKDLLYQCPICFILYRIGEGNEKGKEKNGSCCWRRIVRFDFDSSYCGVGHLLTRKETPEGQAGDVRTYVMDEGNYQQIMEDMTDQVQEGYFETYMTTDWTFPDGNSESTDAMLGNSPNNTKPIRCELLLNETGEKLFETNVLPVGALVSPIKLNRNLDAGTYDATCMIYLMNEKEDGTFEDYSSAGFRVTLIIEN